MQLVAPDILARTQGMSLGVCGAALALGLLLWLFGWWGHRFWIVMFTTVSAGVAGLSAGVSLGVQPFVAGLLLAIAAGMMALALIRLLAFIAGGGALALAIRALVPALEEPLIGFLVGGLIGLVLFRLWIMVLTSFTGALLMVYSGLTLLDGLHKLNAPAIAEGRTLLFNWICGGITLLGVLAQYLVERWKKQLKRRREEEVHLHRAELELEQRYRRRSWWWKKGQGPRRAA